MDKRTFCAGWALVLAVCVAAAATAGQAAEGKEPGGKTADREPASFERRSGGGDVEQAFTVRPIGVIRSPYKDAKGTPIQGVFGGEVQAWVELKDKYVKGLKDLDGFSHAILLYYFHKSGKEEIIAQPYMEGEAHGIFAIRSPNRPNHIGLSAVKIKRIEGNKVYFTEVDVLDGTPVLDIKPYVRQFDSRPDAVSGWIERHYKDGKQPDQKTAK